MSEMRKPRQNNRTRVFGLTGTFARGFARVWILVAVIIAVCAGVLVFGIMPRLEARDALKKESQNLNVPTVSVTKPKPRDGAQELVLPGNIQPFIEAPIYARTSGYLKRWHVDIGARVKAGQLLAEIDTPEIDDQLQQARADFATAQANHQLAEKTTETAIYKCYQVARYAEELLNKALAAFRSQK